MNSKQALWFTFIIIFLASFFYYPKWKKSGTEATISWDVSGYYWYLPAIFIYKDVKKIEFGPNIVKKYRPTPEHDQQTFFHAKSGNHLMKYSIGQAVQYFPFFITAHLLAKPLGFEADGFSLPYQFAIQFGSILICFLGLWYLRKSLLSYFSDKVTAIVLIIIALATNYLNYSAIDCAMTHNWLFTWYSMLIYFTIQFHEKASKKLAIYIGILIGICALTRPTDIISLIIPALWGINSINFKVILERLNYFWKNKTYLIYTIIAIGMLGSIQLIYYKIVSNEFLVYTYGEQKFSWFHPHFNDFIFGFRTGWLIYTPVMFLAIIGIYFLIRRKTSWVALLLFAIINTYIVCAWDIWWYGARAMVQSYPILAFFIAASIEYFDKNKITEMASYLFVALCIYLNIWWTHGVHLGGYYDAFNSTKAYFYKTVGKWNIPTEYLKLLDHKDFYEGSRKNVKIVYSNNFDSDSILVKEGRKINNSTAEFVNKAKQFGKEYSFELNNGDANWLRLNATFQCINKEWEPWRMTQVVIKFFNQKELIKQSFLKPHRFLTDGQTKDLYLDVKIPNEAFSKISIIVWNADGTNELLYDNLRVEEFQE
jgi:hypothetical protein